LWPAVLNAALTELRRRTAPPSQCFAPAATSTPDGDAPYAGMEGAVARLPERQRLVLYLRYYADLDYRAIADALGIAPGTVGAALHAARATLQRHLEEVRT